MRVELLSVSVFVSFFSDFFGSSNIKFVFNHLSGNRVLVSFVGILKDKDIYVFLVDLLNNFIGNFFRDT